MCGGSGAGDVQGARGCRGHWIRGRGCTRRGGCGAGASVYLGPEAEAVCRTASTAAGYPEFPCQIFLPRNCNISNIPSIDERTFYV